MTDDPEAPLTDEEKQALCRLGFNPDASQMSDAEWHEWVEAHSAVVHRKGLGTPIEKGEVEEELARRRVGDK
ncbi:hypothetical protein [Sagittula sp. MA-2]|jgi:hypothetical protein|uniref:hypothetical protein n=1 Tax=Sagittula sp. MA-2 TaxID=3048007 RepID=UPI0024C3461A|nr:hypothetical protein [Sagittula sp. MA-2]WHZ36504.1 hypothetical protein QNI11_05700 [Sagittula sp. MA-2]